MSSPRSKSKNLGTFLKTAREGAGLSQGKVAKKFGYTTPQFVSNWERGVAAPPVKTLKKLGEMYGVDADRLFDALLEDKVTGVRNEIKRAFGRK